MNEIGLTKFAEDLLLAFRRETEKREINHNGCNCGFCTIDLRTALQQVLNDREIRLESTQPNAPQSLVATKVEGIAHAVSELDPTTVAQEDLEMESPLSTPRYQPQNTDTHEY